MPELNLVVETKRRAYSDNSKLPAYYIFNFADSTVFVIVSAESTTLDILAYGDTGYFHVEDLDEGADMFLDQYERDAEIARTKGLNAEQKQFVSRRINRVALSGLVEFPTACLGQSTGNW